MIRLIPVLMICLTFVGCEDPIAPTYPTPFPNNTDVNVDGATTTTSINFFVTFPNTGPPSVSVNTPTIQQNSPPVVGNPGPQSSPADTPVNIPLTIYDPDGDALGIQWDPDNCPRGVIFSLTGITGIPTLSSVDDSPFLCDFWVTEIGPGGLVTTQAFQWTIF